MCEKIAKSFKGSKTQIDQLNHKKWENFWQIGWNLLKFDFKLQNLNISSDLRKMGGNIVGLKLVY